jgi:phosphoenolpyruvate carboxykinase (GTP)
MLPFCGYNMADYFRHWLEIGERDGAKLPHVFHVNWFRKDDDGNFLWPGFGENSRVLAWIFRRCDGEAEAEKTPLGYVPRPDDLPIEGLDRDAVARALDVDLAEAKDEIDQTQEHLARFGDDLPKPIRKQFDELKSRLG